MVDRSFTVALIAHLNAAPARQRWRQEAAARITAAQVAEAEAAARAAALVRIHASTAGQLVGAH